MSSDDLPLPPWSNARERRPSASAKEPLTREAIVEVALALVDEDGLDGVSMRRVSQRLDTGPASLYQHVSGKEELLELVLDKVSADMKIPEPGVGPDGWQEPLKELLRETRRVLGAHQDLAYVTLGRIPTGPNSLAAAEGMLRIMREGGIPTKIAAFAADSLALFVASLVYEEAIQQKMADGHRKDSDYAEGIQKWFAALPADRFPTIVSMAGDFTSADEGEDDRFEFALDVQIRGIEALAAEQRQ